jgi:hypothetical protein
LAHHRDYPHGSPVGPGRTNAIGLHINVIHGKTRQKPNADVPLRDGNTYNRDSMTLAEVLIQHIESLGYTVSVHRMDTYVELRASSLTGDGSSHVARYEGGDGPDEQYHAARLLAAAIGIDID